MNDEQFNILQNKLDLLNQNLVNSHNLHQNWAQAIGNRQIRLEKILGVENAEEPFTPHYIRSIDISTDYPEIFNKYGEKMEVFFINDRDLAHAPNDKNSRYIIWDRYNYCLKTHFYSHDEMFHIVGKPKRKFGLLLEPKAIKPGVYQRVLQNKDYIEKNFEAVFTFDVEVLSTLKNAKFSPLCAYVWYGYEKPEAIYEDNYRRKNKNISMICSAKEMCEGHLRRKKLAFKVKNEKLADTFGKFDGGGYVPIELPFEFYRYSIAVENDIQPFYFTEKILNCFMAQTIPIYLGATEIGRFFNPAGIIQIGVDDCEHIENILAKCTPEEYARRLPAVIDNFNRVKHYANCTRFDDIYVNYLKK